MPKRKKGWLHHLLLNKRALCENHHLSKRRRVEGVHEVEKLPPKVEPMRCGYSPLPSPANYDCYTPSLQRNAISEFMDYGQRIRKQPKLDCHAVCFWPGNPTNTASRLCKRSLFLSFSRINCWQDIGQRTYRETKDLAKNYGDAKEVFESAMYENGYGQWVRKPPEVDLFYL